MKNPMTACTNEIAADKPYLISFKPSQYSQVSITKALFSRTALVAKIRICSPPAPFKMFPMDIIT